MAVSNVDRFITRWQSASGSERANYQLFVHELCTLLDLPTPDPAREDTRDNAAGTLATRDDCKHALDDALLERLVALNAERAAEEKRGLIRWLRPEFQIPASGRPRVRRSRGLRSKPVLPGAAPGRNACRRSSTR